MHTCSFSFEGFRSRNPQYLSLHLKESVVLVVRMKPVCARTVCRIGTLLKNKAASVPTVRLTEESQYGVEFVGRPGLKAMKVIL